MVPQHDSILVIDSPTGRVLGRLIRPVQEAKVAVITLPGPAYLRECCHNA